MQATYAYGAPDGPKFEEPFSDLATALRSRELAVYFVELGGRAADWLWLGNPRSTERAFHLSERYPIREG